MNKSINNFKNEVFKKLNQEDINHLNRCITCNEIEAAINSLLKKKSPGPDKFSTEFHQIFKKLIPTFVKLFHKIDRERTLPNSFYLASITLIPKLDKDKNKKKTKKRERERELQANLFNEHRCKNPQ
jgi:hypothetical protein